MTPKSDIQTEQILSFIDGVCQTHGYDFAPFATAWQESMPLSTKKPSPRTAKSKTDPQKPKRGRSAYIFFCQAQRATVKDTMEVGSKATEVTAELGRQWSALKADPSRLDELGGYQTQASADRIRYTVEMENYLPSDKSIAEIPRPTPGRKKFVKRVGGYDVYRLENKSMFEEMHPALKAGEITKLMAKEWKGMDEHSRQVWKDRAVTKPNDISC